VLAGLNLIDFGKGFEDSGAIAFMRGMGWCRRGSGFGLLKGCTSMAVAGLRGCAVSC
jgi:hypothetical protein